MHSSNPLLYQKVTVAFSATIRAYKNECTARFLPDELWFLHMYFTVQGSWFYLFPKAVVQIQGVGVFAKTCQALFRRAQCNAMCCI